MCTGYSEVILSSVNCSNQQDCLPCIIDINCSWTILGTSADNDGKRCALCKVQYVSTRTNGACSVNPQHLWFIFTRISSRWKSTEVSLQYYMSRCCHQSPYCHIRSRKCDVGTAANINANWFIVEDSPIWLQDCLVNKLWCGMLWPIRVVLLWCSGVPLITRSAHA